MGIKYSFNPLSGNFDQLGYDWIVNTTTNNIYPEQSVGLYIPGTTGDTPTSGAGTRFMWIPSKAAIRAGSVNGTQWDADNIGTASAAFGRNVKASGSLSFCVGNDSSATGDSSVGVGGSNAISGNYAVGIGGFISIQPVYGVGIGSSISIYGDYGIGIGNNLVLNSSNSVNVGIGSTTTDASFSFGYLNNVSGEGAFGAGYYAQVAGIGAIGIGTSPSAYADYAIAIGSSSQTWGTKGIALGNGSTSSSEGDIVFGNGGTVSSGAKPSFLLVCGKDITPTLSQDNSFVIYGEQPPKDETAFFAGVGTILTPQAQWHIGTDCDTTAGLSLAFGQLFVSGSTDISKKVAIGYDTTNSFGWVQAGEGTDTYTSLLLNPLGGNVGIGVTSSSYTLEVGGDVYLHGDIMLLDSEKAIFGTGADMDMYYNGTSGYIHTDLVAASDLHIDCGTDKTLVLDETVYNDANVGSLVLRTGGTAPGVVQLVDEAGANTGIYGVGFAVNEEGSGAIEIPHDYKEGTNLTFHVHWGANDAPTGTDYVKWSLTYTVSRDGATLDAATTITVETPYDTQYERVRSDFTAITGTNFKIGDQFLFSLKRVTAAGDAYGGEALTETVGFHYETDTLGSRQMGTK